MMIFPTWGLPVMRATPSVSSSRAMPERVRPADLAMRLISRLTSLGTEVDRWTESLPAGFVRFIMGS